MLILLKQSIKTTIILLLLMSGRTYLYSSNSLLHINQWELVSKPLTINRLHDQNLLVSGYYFLEDTVTTSVSDTVTKKVMQEDKLIIPDQLANTQINFRINSFINYLNFNHFVRNESKKLFFQAWLKEKELKRLSDQTDSLRNVYAKAASWQKEEISLQILKAEERSISLNEEIPAMYQKTREEEDLYWQSASLDEIAKFQEKIRIYKDSIGQNTGTKSGQPITIHSEIPDTIILYKSSPKTEEKKADVAEGIIYKIQIGAYKGKIPDSAKKLIKKLSAIRKVENYVDEKGASIYTTGKLRLYKEALTMQNQVKQEGIKNAMITAYQNGKQITVNEARKINNEL